MDILFLNYYLAGSTQAYLKALARASEEVMGEAILSSHYLGECIEPHIILDAFTTISRYNKLNTVYNNSREEGEGIVRVREREEGLSRRSAKGVRWDQVIPYV